MNTSKNCEDTPQKQKEGAVNGYDKLVEPKEPTRKEKVEPPYTYKLALNAGGGRILKYLLTSLIIISHFMVCFTAITLGGSLPAADFSGFYRILFIFGIVALLFGTTCGIFTFAYGKGDESCCFGKDYVIGAPFTFLFYAINGVVLYTISGGEFSSLSTTVYGERFLRERIAILAVALAVGIISTVVCATVRVVNGRKLKKILYGSVKAKKKDIPAEQLNWGDWDYLVYRRYLVELAQYKKDKKEYEMQMARKAQGLPFKKSLSWRVKLSSTTKKYLAYAAVVLGLLFLITVVLPLKKFEINALKLMSVSNISMIENHSDKVLSGDAEEIKELYGNGNNAEDVLGAPTVTVENGDYVEWIYYDRTVAKAYARIQEIEGRLKELSEQNEQYGAEYNSLQKEREELEKKILQTGGYYRIEVKFKKRKDGLMAIESIEYRWEDVKEALFGYQERAKDFDIRVFSFSLEYELGEKKSWKNCRVRTRYEDGSFTFLKIPESAFEAVDTSRVGVYTVSWDDPITGQQRVEITVK